MPYKITAKLVVLIVIALLLLPAHLSEAFNDTNGHSNEYAINYLYGKGVIQGYDDGSYAPESTINRAEFVKILIESKYPGEGFGTDCFNDVGTEWYAPYACYAEDLAIVEGYSDGYFRPANEINLAEALKIVLETYDFDVCTSCYSIWYEPYYWEARPNGLLDRIDNDVEHTVTRGEMAQLVYNVENYLAGLPLIFDDSISAESIPNVAILEFEENDECRYSNGNVRGDCVVDKFYQNHEDNYDMIMVIDVGDYAGKHNGWASYNVHRYVPSNLGIEELCDETCLEKYPERLRFMNQSGDSWADSGDTVFVHELGHYWGVDWLSTDLSCYDESWIEYAFENSHWTELFQAGGGASIMSYQMNVVSEGEPSGITKGILTDNHDGTFSFSEEELPRLGHMQFNAMDLYAMGLIDEEELGKQEIYVVLNPGEISENLYSGTRHDFSLYDFQNLLLEKEECEGTGPNFFYTGDGSRQLNEYDDGVELAENFNVAIVLIKFPEQKITNEDAYYICERVNYDWIDSWNLAAHGLSEIDTHINGDDPIPDCADLYAE